MSKNRLFDSIRKKWIEETPEERVRQALLKKMIDELGFQKGLLCVEKNLDFFPSNKSTFSKRRLDILAYAKGKLELFPLLLIECKAIPLNNEVVKQVVGYNHFIGARFMGIVNESAFKLMWNNKEGKLESIDFLPSYEELISLIKHS